MAKEVYETNHAGTIGTFSQANGHERYIYDMP